MEIEDFKILFSKLHEEIMKEKKKVFSIVIMNGYPIVRIEHDEYVWLPNIKKWYSHKYEIPYEQISVIPEPKTIQCDLGEYV